MVQGYSEAVRKAGLIITAMLLTGSSLTVQVEGDTILIYQNSGTDDVVEVPFFVSIATTKDLDSHDRKAVS